VKTIKEVLIDARKLLSESGWTQGTMHDQTTNCYCALGAIRVAAGMKNPKSDSRWSGHPHDAEESAAQALSNVAAGHILDVVAKARDEVVGVREVFITRWNDSAIRTKEDVINTFDKAISAIPVNDQSAS
jgi:hypothetical protein